MWAAIVRGRVRDRRKDLGKVKLMRRQDFIAIVKVAC